MLDTTTFVGLDVHARSIKAVSLDVMTGEVRAATFGYDAGAVAEWVRSVDPRARCVYESGVTGFDLQKRLSGLGVDCVVGAVSKMIKPSADRRRKNDRNDAEFLARMLSVGNVVEVWVPDDECEAARDLTRALEDARDDLSRSKQRLSKFLLRHGLAFDERTPTGRRKGNWTRAHWSWIRKRFDPKPLRRTSGPFSASAQGATRVHRLSVRRRSLSRSNGLPSERSPRADIKLQRRASVRHAEVAADGLI
jgi:transposase